MKAYGIGSWNGVYACGCCGGASMKHDSNKTETQKRCLRLAKKKARRDAKKEVQQEVTNLFSS